MGYEVELKYRDVDHDALRRALEALGAEEGATLDEEDLYLNHPARDFAASNEAFRVRSIGEDNRVTYKGPKEPGPTKTREEIEVPFAPGPLRLDELTRMFDVLGFRRVALVRKRRTPFRLTFGGRPLEVTLDRADELGDFAEVEALALDRDDLPDAQQAVLDLAAELGLATVEPRSYLRMLLEKRAQPSM